MFTSWIIASIPFRVSLELFTDLKDNDSSAQSNGKPTTSTCEPTNSLPELQFCDFLAQRIVPHDHFVWRIEWTPTTTQEEEQIGCVQRKSSSECPTG